MPLLPLLLAGGVIYVGVKACRQWQKEQKRTSFLQAAGSQNQSFFEKLDARYQTFVQTRIDPLLAGRTRHQQMEALVPEDERSPLGEAEKRDNRYLACSVITCGTALLGTSLFPPLLLLSTAAAIYLTLPAYIMAYRSLTRERRVKLDLIVALYMTGMWLGGYLVFGAVSCFLYFLGRKVVFQAEARSRQGLLDVFGQQPRFVWRLVDGVEVQIPFEQLQAGDSIVVNAGEPVPVDGVITEGIASIDQRILTGEAQPAEKEVGDSVLASTLVLTGRLHIRVEKTGSETTVAQIGKILSQTAAHQTDIEVRGQELAHRTALPNLLLSGLAWPLRGFTGATAVLGSGVGLNLRMVSLLSMLNYLRIASQRSILIKEGRALERLHAVDTVVFDKTGTLTLEQPHLAKIHRCDGMREDDLLTYAAAAEYHQTHPIARAILSAARERGLTLPPIDEASYEVGYGVKVSLATRSIRVGSDRFMTLEGIAIPAPIQALQATCQQAGHSLVMVALDERLVGALELHATLRPEIDSVVAELRRRKLSIAILSGDQEQPTKALARELGIDTYFANTLPENKAALIEQLQHEGRVVCFIGDGINDAIALKQADVSISLRGATTIATDTAQIVLMDQGLRRVSSLLDLAEEFDKTIRAGIIVTFIPGVICIGGVFLLGFGIYAAEILFQLGLFCGLGVAMKPLLGQRGRASPLSIAPSQT